MDGIDKLGGASDLARVLTSASSTGAVTATTAVTDVKSATTQTTADTSNLISLLADASPPVDAKKVEAIQSLIASGAYPIDSHAIAAKMLALDFPANGASADA